MILAIQSKRIIRIGIQCPDSANSCIHFFISENSFPSLVAFIKGRTVLSVWFISSNYALSVTFRPWRMTERTSAIFIKFKIPQDDDTPMKFENHFYHHILEKIIKLVAGSDVLLKFWFVPTYNDTCGESQRICRHCISERFKITSRMDPHRVGLLVGCAFQRVFINLRDYHYDITGFKKIYIGIY